MPYNFLERAKHALDALLGKAPSSVGVGWFNGSDGIFWTDRDKIPAERLMKQMRNWVFACVRAISERVGQANLRLYKVGKSGAWDEIESHELLELLHAPSQNMTKVELLELTSAHMELTGNAYWFLEGTEGKNPKAKPTGIDVISPTDIEPILTQDKKQVAAWKIKRADGLHYDVLPAHSVLHIKYVSPLNKLAGLGATEAAADAIDSDNYARQFQRNFFKKGAVPSVFLSTPAGTTTEARQHLQQTFEERYMGENQRTVAAIPSGTKIDVINQNPRDMEFVELRRVSRDEIFAMYRVPHVILGLGAGENLNRATADTTEYVFAKYTIQPKVDRIVMFVNEYLVPLFGDNLVLDSDSMVPENVELGINRNRAALGNKAWMTVNEIRIEDGLEPVEGGDVIPDGGTNPLDALLAGKARKKAKKGPKPRHIVAWERRTKRAEELKTGIESALKAAVKAIEPSKYEAKALTQEEVKGDWEAQWKAMSDVAESYQKRLKEAMSEYAHQMGKRASENMTGSKSVGRKAASILDKQDEVKAIMSALGEIIEELVKEQGKIAGAMVDYEFAYSELVKEAIDKRLATMAGKYTDETIALLERELKESAENNETQEELKDRIKLIEEFSADTRAARVAVTESYWNANTATRMAWKESGSVKTVKWYTSSNERVCQFCGPLHGKTVGIDENWYNVGDTVDGSAGGKLNVDFADVGNPPLHPNCQCFIRPEEISFT